MNEQKVDWDSRIGLPDEISLKSDRMHAIDKQLKSSAFISPCRKYRYSLTRIWDNSKPIVMFIMLNPSTADGKQDDPTIRRCIGFSKTWGFGGLFIGNLFAFRSTNPNQLLQCEDPIGPQNKYCLDTMANKSDMIVCAWGNSSIVNKITKRYNGEYKPLKGLLKLNYLDLSKDGTPKHPLYLKRCLTPKEYQFCKINLF